MGDQLHSELRNLFAPQALRSPTTENIGRRCPDFELMVVGQQDHHVELISLFCATYDVRGGSPFIGAAQKGGLKFKALAESVQRFPS